MKRLIQGLLLVAALLISQATNAQQKIPANIVFANLSGPDMAAIVQEDAAAIGPLFRRSYVTPVGQVSIGQVLFLYLDLDEDGSIRGSNFTVREIIDLTQAPIVVIASELQGNGWQKVAEAASGKSNLIFTNNRNGPGFTKFFRRLFEMMRDGKEMLMAYVELAPQGPQQDPSLPGTILIAGRGNVVFAK